MSGYISIRVLRSGSVELTFAVVAEAHLCLAEANGVLALAHAVELFEFFLINALQVVSIRFVPGILSPSNRGSQKNWAYLGREVNLDGLDADVGWSRAHIE